MVINKDEVLRYLGYKGQKIGAELDHLINSCIQETKTLAKPLFAYKIFDIISSSELIELEECSLSLKSRDIQRHLGNSKACVILAATLGAAVENRIRYLSKIDLTHALILDACAAEAVEGLCNEVEKEIRSQTQCKLLSLTNRYSPGYGDFPLSVQPQIINALKADKAIGLTCTDDFILLPRKSVTAIMGLYDASISSSLVKHLEASTLSSDKTNSSNRLFNGCSDCISCSSRSSCLYRREV